MKSNYTHIGFIMDRSGSMQTLAIEASNAFNEFIREQREVDGEATLTFVDFDNTYRVLNDFTHLDDVEEYVLQPGGTTALLDAIGRTINSIGERLSGMPEEERPEKVLIAIMTDGYENASQEFTREQIREMIERQENDYNWVFMYLGANQDAFAVAQSFGISMNNAMNYAFTAQDMNRATKSIGNAATVYRSASFAGDVTSLLSDNEELDANN